MHNQRFKKILGFILLLICGCFLVLFSCRKDPETGAGPVVHFKIDTGYVYQDDTVLIGKYFKVGIVAERGDANITNFIIKVTNDSVHTYLDSGMNTESLNIDKSIIKGLGSHDVWTFTVRDKLGNSTSVSFNLYADSSSAFGPVINIPSLILGAQNNTSVGSFLDVKNVTVYNLNDAFTVQDSIEMLYFYDAIGTDANTIASPNANIDASVFPGTYGLANWTIKNETRYLLTSFTSSDFDSFSNDSLLIVSYDEPNAKRKAKNLAPGLIYVFKTAKGKLGMFEVLNVDGTDAGTVEIKIKIQPY
jgi:hypothetical protein